MGNRAVVKAKGNRNKAVYLHWNGGRDSVEAFLKYCELRGFRSFEDDYGMARFIQVVSNFLSGNGLNVGVVDDVDSCGDNGVYVVSGWDIVDRIDFEGTEQNTHDLQEMLIAIDEAQPKKQQLGKNYLEAERVKTTELKIGDKVYLMEIDGQVKVYSVAGIGKNERKNGTNVENIPYVNRYLNDNSYANNINNYIQDDYVRVVKDKQE